MLGVGRARIVGRGGGSHTGKISAALIARLLEKRNSEMESGDRDS